MDTLSSLLGRHAFNAKIFFNGTFCDANDFHENPASGHLHLVRQGPVEFVHADGTVLRVDRPSLVLYPRGARHRLQVPAGCAASLLCANIVFADGASNPLARVLPACLHVALAEVRGLSSTLELLYGEAADPALGRELVLDRLCDVLLIQVIRREFDSGRLSPTLLAGLSDRQLSLALAAIHEQPHEPWSVASLAAVACMSRAAFTEYFSEVMGVPPGEYLMRWRIAHAGKLLRQGISVKLASARSGYASPAAFTRAFNALMGVSPREWLKLAA